ncbi:MAG: Rid family detoxifying hydrolase [Acidimicrobiales bacterium]
MSAGPVGPYSPWVRAGGWVVTSGQLGLVDGALVHGGVEVQTAQALQNLAAVLAEAGASLADVCKTTVFLVDMADFAAMNGVYAEAFGRHRPARSTVAVAGLPLGAVVEVEAWAYRPQRD